MVMFLPGFRSLKAQNVCQTEGHGGILPAGPRVCHTGRARPAGTAPGRGRMPTYHIEGGFPLRGRIHASGAKNAATKQIVASLLTDEEVVLHNVPRIGDVNITIEIVKSLG